MVRLACVSGFLGAGKTTALLAAARILNARGLRVGIVTNDQGSHLVDTALARSSGFYADEITGGCFCCRFKDFLAHAHRMMEQYHPDFIFAEAVGSCTDLAATVYRPLQKYYADQFELAPLSVLVEPARIGELLAGSSRQFEESVSYLFQKQLAEAELIILNKTDMIDAGENTHLNEQIREIAGGIPIISMSATNGVGVDEWVEHLLSARTPAANELDLDYEIYGRAEASLGWLNATVDVVSTREFSPIEFGQRVIASIQETCKTERSPIAHLKLLVATSEGSDQIAVTTNEGHAKWAGAATLSEARELSVIINARVGATPEILRQHVEDALANVARQQGASAKVQDMEAFAPPPPARPVYAE